MLSGEEGRGLVSVIPDLVKGNQLVRERVRLLLSLLEMQGIVQIRSRWQRGMMGQTV